MTAITDTASLRTAVTAWCSDAVAAFSTYGHISSWDTTRVTDMSYLFSDDAEGGYCSTYSTFNEDLSGWDTSQVTNMERMFYGASSFNQDLSSFDTSRVTSMYLMFYGASSFNQDSVSYTHLTLPTIVSV